MFTFTFFTRKTFNDAVVSPLHYKHFHFSFDQMICVAMFIYRETVTMLCILTTSKGLTFCNMLQLNP